MAVARDLSGGDNRVVCVIGERGNVGGDAYEAMNNAGHLGSGLVVILNDNDMSIAPPVGAMSAYLARLVSGRTYRSVRRVTKRLVSWMPRFIRDRVRLTEVYARAFGPAARCSSSSVSIMSGRSTTGIGSTIFCRS